ncbi:MAG TPA: tetratricopeptide repeat protein [Pirellulaceae bacterium]|nr:tetratricopeptide repeat protein [Pirellulaceae bacterium]
MAGAWLASVGGCRALRCEQAQDEALASARQLSLHAMELQEHGRWEQSEALFAAAVQQCPADERARCGYAQALWQRGARDQAVSHMEEAVRLSGHDPERLVQLGEMYLFRGELQRAGQQADRAIAANSQLAAAWALRAQVEQAEGRREEALAKFHRALSLREQYPEVQLAIADIYAQDGRPQRALGTLQALAANYPPAQVPADVLIREGFALRDLGRFQDAAIALAQAAERGNASAELYYELARVQLRAGDTSAARQSALAALQRDPSHTASQALARDLAPREGIIAAATPESPSRLY